MLRIIYAFSIFALLSCSTQAQIDDLFNKAKKVVTGESSMEEETGAALKEALNLGIEKAVNELSAEDGYLDSPYKILIPEDARHIVNKVSSIPGFQNVEQDLIDKMNKAAELAASKATPIFVGAVKSMTIEDATNILLGEKDAATRYLEKSTRDNLYDEFMPVIQSSLDEVNAREYWRSVVKTYNKIPFVTKLNPELDDHVNNAGLDGLFGLIETKEEGIRKDQDQRTTELLRKVFARQD